MLQRARQRLSSLSNVIYEHSDFVTSLPPAENDLIIAIRSFEYFEDKLAALCRMRDLLAPGGDIVIVTKNTELLTRHPVQHGPLREGQLSRFEMQELVRDAGLTIVESYPAVLRLQAIYPLMRSLSRTSATDRRCVKWRRLGATSRQIRLRELSIQD